MDWILIAVTLALFIAYVFLRRQGQISVEAAAAHLQNGALLIDVRSPAEYAAGHLSPAINLPLPQIESLISTRVHDKNQVLLLHCQSGTRSGVAKNKLNALGYTRVYNLGSYDRAARILNRN
jgi:phage shock protein E